MAQNKFAIAEFEGAVQQRIGKLEGLRIGQVRNDFLDQDQHAHAAHQRR